MADSVYPDTQGGIHAANYRVYIQNLGSFATSTSRIDLWVKDGPQSRTAHLVPEDVPRTIIPAHTEPGHSITVHFQDLALDLAETVGSSIECEAGAPSNQ